MSLNLSFKRLSSDCCGLWQPLARPHLGCFLQSRTIGCTLNRSREPRRHVVQQCGIHMSAAPSEGSAAAAAPAEEPLLQYVVLRKDLWETQHWPLGSIVAQACHASTASLWCSRDSPETLEYCSENNLDSMHKVVLETKGAEQLHNLSKSLTEANIAHKLWIEQPENVPTSLATAPNRKAILQPYFKKLKLCKGVQLRQ